MTTRAPLISGLALLLATLGCFDRDLSGKPCDASNPCLDGFICGAGRCLPPGEACVGNTDCAPPETCVGGLCENVDPDCVDGDGDRRGDACDAGGDCDDDNPAIFALVDAFVDGDLDGVGAGATVGVCSDGTIPAGHAATDTDCDDADAAGQVTVGAFVDGDLDGVGAGPAVTLCSDGTVPAGHAATDTDCNDGDAAGQVTVSAFVDGDGDGAGAGPAVTLCTDGTIPAGHAATDTDCDDTVAAVGQAPVAAFVDGDRDGVGAGAAVTLCVANGVIPAGHAATGTDCNDADGTVSVGLPGFVDADLDGIGAGGLTTLCTGGALGAGQSATGGDNCAAVANADQRDEESDGVGDACDICPVDGDAGQANTLETDAGQTADTVGDACDPRPGLGGDAIALFNSLDTLDGWQIVAGTWVATANGFRQNTSNGSGFLRRLNFTGANQLVEARLLFGFQADDIVGLAARVDSNGDGYACAMNRQNNTLELRLVDNHALAGTLASTAQTAPAVNTPFTLRFTLVGSSLGCTFVGGASVNAVDATHGAGTIGLATSATRATIERAIVYSVGP